MKRILVIVVTYNGEKWVQRCFGNLSGSTIKTDVFVVDNGSSDRTVELVKEICPEAILVESKENLGFGKANNLGLKYALDKGYDYVYLLNQDAWVEVDTFEKMIEVSEKNKEYGILSPLQTTGDGRLLDKNFSLFCPRDLISDSLLNELRDIYETDFVMAAHWLITRGCLETVGGFSPTFYHYGEDNNYIDRVKYFGLKVGICPLVKGVHDREYREESKKRGLFFVYVSWLIYGSKPGVKYSFFRMLHCFLINTVTFHSFYLCGLQLKALFRFGFIKRNVRESLKGHSFLKGLKL